MNKGTHFILCLCLCHNLYGSATLKSNQVQTSSSCHRRRAETFGHVDDWTQDVRSSSVSHPDPENMIKSFHVHLSQQDRHGNCRKGRWKTWCQASKLFYVEIIFLGRYLKLKFWQLFKTNLSFRASECFGKIIFCLSLFHTSQFRLQDSSDSFAVNIIWKSFQVQSRDVQDKDFEGESTYRWKIMAAK